MVIMNYCNYRELGIQGIVGVLNNTAYCRLAVAENNEPYIVPVNFRWMYENEHFLFFLQCPEHGEKMESMEKNKKVALEFEYDTCNVMATVTVKGHVVGMSEVSSGCGNGSCCGQNCVSIEIEADTITGREFFKNGCGSCGCTGCNS